MRLGVAALIAIIALGGCDAEPRAERNEALSDRQAQVAERGQVVMPFDLDRSIHRFRALPTGGLQQIVSTDRDPAQVAIIRDHLRQEAERFRRGDFGSPTAIHGAEMPGLKALSESGGRVRIDYADLPAGAEIRYSADQPELVEALHQWFEAQLADHGRHAVGH